MRPLSIHFASREDASALRADADPESFREIRGFASEADLFGALSTALQFPDYFGHNWDAVVDCLREVDGDVILLVHDAAGMWRDAPEVASMLVDVWLNAAEEADSELQLVFVW